MSREGDPADALYVDVEERSPLAAARAAVRTCAALGPWAVVRAVPWPADFRCVEDAARKMASGTR